MGWLRELMRSADPPVRSFGELARAAVASDEWPATVQSQPRSLAALFSKLDREQELEWLADRTDVQHVLAERLGCPVADLRRLAWPSRGPDHDAVRRLRLRDARFARAIDWLEEGPPPGLPEAVLHPERWDRLWWLADSGAGRSLLGHFLEARARARFAQGWDAEALASAAPVLIELREAPAAAPGPLVRRGVCVAAPFPPERLGLSGFDVVHSPPLDAFLGPLVRWMGARLPAEGGFEPDAALACLSGHTLLRARPSLGVALGLCGAIDELGLDAVARSSPADLVQRFARLRLSQAADEGSADAAWLRRNALAVLGAMARRALTDGERPFGEPRSEDEWFALVPEEHRGGADVAWLELSLSRSASHLKPADVAKAARHVPPGAFRIVRALRSAGLLQSTDGERLSPAPTWFAQALEHVALHSLLDGSPFEWGEAVLTPSTASVVLRRLLDAVLAGTHDHLADVAELEADESTAQVAALEASFRVAGLAVAAGRDVPREHLETLWEEQARLCLDLGDGVPSPRIPHRDDDGAPTAPGWFLLAALAISERLPARRTARMGALDPWRATSVPPTLVVVLDRIAEAVGGAFEQRELRLGSLVVADRLRQAVGPVAANGALHPLQRPGKWVDDLMRGDATLAELSTLDPRDARLTIALGERLGHAPQRVVDALWRAWQRAGEPSLHGTPLAPEQLPVAWQLASAAVWLRAAEVALSAGAEPVLIRTDSAWPELCARSKGCSAHLQRFFAAHVPDAHAEALIAAVEPPDPAVGEMLWSRFRRTIERRLEQRLDSGQLASAGAWLAAAPLDVLPTLAAQHEPTRFESATDDVVLAVRRALHRAVAQRTPRFRELYAWLAAFERAVALPSPDR